MTPDEIASQYEAPIGEAKNAYESAAKQLTFLNEQLDSLPPSDEFSGDPRRAALEKERDQWIKAYNEAQTQYVTILRQRADAMLKAKADATPEARARLEAQTKADTAKAAQIEAEAKEFLESAPDRRATAKANADLARARAEQADAEAAVTRATTPQAIAAAEEKVRQAQAQTRALELQNQQREKDLTQKPEDNLTPGQRAEDAAKATTASESAGLALDTQRTQLEIAKEQLAALQRQAAREPTESDARKVIEQNIRQKELEIKGLEEDQQKGKLGRQYGLAERAQAIRDAYVRGDFGTGPDALNRMNEAWQAELSGTTPFEMAKERQRAAEVQDQREEADRTMRAGFERDRMSQWNTAVNQGFGQFRQLNDTVDPGSDAAGKGFLAFMNLMQQRLGQFQPPPMAPSQAAQNPAGAVTINIGAPTGAPAPNQAQPATQPQATVSGPFIPPPDVQAAALAQLGQQGSPQPQPTGFTNPLAPATPEAVDQLWGRTPTATA